MLPITLRGMNPTSLVLTEEFEHALACLHAGKSMFLTGKAGTGKSTLIRYFLEHTDRRVAVVAPTGIAALNVDGYTIHRFFGFRPGISAESIASGAYKPQRFTPVIRALDTLIIDEASMVRADLFDAVGAALEKFGPHPDRPFGGVQVVLVGDLFQLPPVVVEGEAEYFATRYSSPYFFAADRFNRELFESCQLTHVFRQAGDPHLTEILNAIREGTIDEEARDTLNENTDADFRPDTTEFWLTLTTTNRIATARNKAALAELSGETFASRGTLSGEVDIGDLPTDHELQYKVGAQVMMLVNDPAGRFVNGTLGKITGIERDEFGMRVTVLARDGVEFSVGPHVWETTRPYVDGGQLRHEVVGTFTQLPFRLAWAITIHKSQGQTLDRLIVDLSGGTFAYGQLYVALSRCTSLAGLKLRRNVLARDLKTDQRIRRFLAGGTTRRAAGKAFLGVCFAGNVGQRTRPRPVEIAAITDDGEEMSTLVNPESDLYDSRQRFNINAGDVLAAPTLAEAWPALQGKLAGKLAVGLDIDEQLSFIDFELKRNGYVEQIPLGINVPRDALTPAELRELEGSTAIERARAARRVAERLEVADAFAEPFEAPSRPGFLLPRGTQPAECLVGGLCSEEDERGIRESVASRVADAQQSYDLDALLQPGVRICFTGTVLDERGRAISREDMEEIAQERGLTPVGNVSKTRCDVLVCAEVGTQSGKARKAAEWGKPIILADDFLAWAR